MHTSEHQCLQLGVLGLVPVVRDQLLEPPTSALVALIDPKKSLGSRGWQIN